ncbi:MAG TPA: MG2 domain-containing protein [Polyangiaceae bacterium]|nr:MG2 domain-containing protein [Polyangiaceae bacterium]
MSMHRVQTLSLQKSILTRKSSRSPRRLSWPGRTACALVASLLSTALGCGDSDSTRVAPIPLGTPEVEQSNEIRIDADAIVGHIEGSRVQAEIPITAHVTSSGELEVSLRSVDDKVFASTRVEYGLVAGETRPFVASLRLPEPVSDQAALVQYNLVVRNTGPVHIVKSLQHVVPPYEVVVEGPGRLSANKQVSYRVAARNPLTRAPLPNQPLELVLSAADGSSERHALTTDATGTASLGLSVPEAGQYSVSASASAFGVDASVAESIEVASPSQRLLLTTDKPIYKPGQTIHVRTLSLAASDRRPNANEELSLEIEDGKGNKVFKRALATDAYGVASADFTLGSILNQGTFKLRVLAGAASTEKTVDVFEYALPKFDVGIDTDKAWYAPGESVVVDLDAHYFFGKPVSLGEVVVELGAIVVGEVPFGRVVTRTDESGRVRVTLDLPAVLPGLDINAGNALAFVRVTATDGAGQTVSKERALTVAPAALDISLVPEAGRLVAGIENQLDLFVTDPLGAPVPEAQADVVVGGSRQSLTTDRYGHARLAMAPAAGDVFASVEVTAAGQEVRRDFNFSEQEGADHLLVRTERAVYDVGEDVDVEVLTTTDGLVFVDWLNDGQAVDMRTLTATGGRARFTLPIDASLLGENRIEAYVVDADGNIVRAGRTLFARGGTRLQIAMSSDHPTYTPGQPARITFDVKDETGAPAVAALGIQIVDQAVFALTDAKPGLLTTYFELEDDFARPSYEIHAPGGDLATLLLDQTAQGDAPARAAAQTRAAANLAALGASSVTGVRGASWDATVQASQALLEPFIETEKEALQKRVAEVARSAATLLASQGCSASVYYCSDRSMPFEQALATEIGKSLVAYDFWGEAYEVQAPMWNEAAHLVSRGPDERAGSGDDFSVVVGFDTLRASGLVPELTLVPGGSSPGEGAAGGAGTGNFPPAVPDDNAGVPASGGDESGSGSEPRVRQDFPETLYVNPSLITDSSGRASIELDMADSITEWRVSALGNTADGKLGGSVNGVTVFQDFFVDVNFPATLTRGDEVDFPIAVYNYLDTPQTVQIALDAADWYTPLGDTSLSLDLAAGEVRGVSVPVRVETVGLETLTVRGTSTGASDAVARRVRVVPDGKAFPTALSGSLEPGSIAHDLAFPAGAVPGSQQLYLNVYPAFLSQAVSGMDSVLQVPDGCFEQTTSTTWPNVLVTSYMRAAGQITPEIELKAQSLISAGYQRLLTFEHPGGGFSWFGTQDPAPFLSVTAFGLMEFADMKAVHPIDEAMLARTQNWLVAQQAGDGSWTGDQTEFFSFHTSKVRNTAFVLWALGENGYTGPAVAPGLAYVKANLDGAESSERDDPYTLALVANALVLLRDPDADSVLARLDALKHVDGDEISWSTSLQTDFYGGGNDADVTATALAAYAMLKSQSYPATAEGALAFITASKDPAGNFGSTQATTWSLKTLLLAAQRGTDGAVGSFEVAVDGAPFTSLELTANQADVMTTVDMSALASAGEHEVELRFVGTGRVSYNLVGSHHLPWSAVPPEPSGPLSIALSYDQTTLAVNDSVHATARIENLTDATANMVLVTLGVPPGFEVELSSFQPYLDSGVLSKAEVAGRQLNLYVSALAARQTQSFEYALRATMPVRASDGGAEVALYYQPNQKSQAAATTLTVNE